MEWNVPLIDLLSSVFQESGCGCIFEGSEEVERGQFQGRYGRVLYPTCQHNFGNFGLFLSWIFGQRANTKNIVLLRNSNNHLSNNEYSFYQVRSSLSTRISKLCLC